MKPRSSKYSRIARDRFRTHSDVVLQLRPAQVEIAIFETRDFVREVLGARDLELERRHLCLVEDQDLARHGPRCRRSRALRCACLRARRPSPLTAMTNSPRMFLALAWAAAARLFVDNDLRHAVAIAQVDKRQTPKSRFFATQPIKTTCCPTCSDHAAPRTYASSLNFPSTSNIKDILPAKYAKDAKKRPYYPDQFGCLSSNKCFFGHPDFDHSLFFRIRPSENAQIY